MNPKNKVEIRNRLELFSILGLAAFAVVSLLVLASPWAAKNLGNTAAVISGGGSTPWIGIEAEATSLSGGATVASNSSASGGQMIQFTAGTVTPPPTPPPTPTPTPPPPISPGAKPSAANTGARVALTPYSGPSPLKISNVTYRGIDFSKAGLSSGAWTGNNITFIDCDLGAFSGFLLTHDIVISHSFAQRIQLDGVTRATLDHLDMSGFGDDPIQVFSSHAMNYDVAINNNWMHNGGVYTNHVDGVQVRGGVRVTISGNNIDIPYSSSSSTGYVNSALLIDAPGTTGGNAEILVDSNWLNGGGYTFRMGNPTPGNITLTNNRFGRQYLYGLFINHTGGTTLLQKSTGNVWDDNGQPATGIPIVP